MKARIFITTVLMIVALATYAQTSRRSERNKEQSTQVQERRTNDSKSNNNVKENRSVSRRENTVERKQENPKSSNTQTQTQTNQSRRGNPGNSENRSGDVNQQKSRRPVSDNNENRRVEGHGNDSKRVVESHDNGKHNGEIRRSNRGNREYVYIDHHPRRSVVVRHPNHYVPRPVEYRRVHQPYRAPLHHEVYWTINLFHDFRIFYPEVRYWRYETGYHFPSVPAYDAFEYIGEVAHIYGRVFEVYHEYETDDYFLYFGDYYPYQDLTVIIPGYEARRLGRNPERLLKRNHIAITGYVTEFDNKPEIVVRKASQINIY